jgi:hypothetical protein
VSTLHTHGNSPALPTIPPIQCLPTPEFDDLVAGDLVAEWTPRIALAAKLPARAPHDRVPCMVEEQTTPTPRPTFFRERSCHRFQWLHFHFAQPRVPENSGRGVTRHDMSVATVGHSHGDEVGVTKAGKRNLLTKKGTCRAPSLLRFRCWRDSLLRPRVLADRRKQGHEQRAPHLTDS